MSKKVLITGGAGFVGSHLTDALLARGYEVRILDNLTPQVHGAHAEKPSYLSPEAEFIKGDIRDRGAVQKALKDADIIFHLAARVGVGQSMYDMADYMEVNSVGTAILLEEIVNRGITPDRLIVASSMSIYGEGLYKAGDRMVADARRSATQLRNGQWEPGMNGHKLHPCPTAETKMPALSSVYALSKYDQERLCLIAGQAYRIPAVALRFFNIYGPRQALSNPYTGVLAIFASRYLNNKAPIIFEDGMQLRDFVSVYDVVNACCLAMKEEKATGEVFNIGSGEPRTVRAIAEMMATLLHKNQPPLISGKYRVGDVRHCFADISKARDILGYQPQVEFEQGLLELTEWLHGQVATDRVDEATAELDSRGLRI